MTTRAAAQAGPAPEGARWPVMPAETAPDIGAGAIARYTDGGTEYEIIPGGPGGQSAVWTLGTGHLIARFPPPELPCTEAGLIELAKAAVARQDKGGT